MKGEAIDRRVSGALILARCIALPPPFRSFFHSRFPFDEARGKKKDVYRVFARLRLRPVSNGNF